MDAQAMLDYLLGLQQQGKDLEKIGFIAQTDTWISLYPGALHQSPADGQAILLSWQPLPGDRDYQPIE
jgi:hypothetical protein